MTTKSQISHLAARWKCSPPPESVGQPSEATILRVIDDYVRTGLIADLLRPYFDQRGRWIGAPFSWSKFTYWKAKNCMKTARLSAHRISARSVEGKLVLHTSLVIRSQTPVSVPWYEIRGSVRLMNYARFEAPELRRIGGHFRTKSAMEIDLPELMHVGGDFATPHARLLRVPRLKHVGGSLIVLAFELPDLETVGQCLSVRFSDTLDAPSLISVGGSLEAAIAQRIAAPKLELVGVDLISSLITTRMELPRLRVVGGDLLAYDARIFNAPRLAFVGGNLTTCACVNFFKPDLHVCGYWLMHPKAAKVWASNEAARIVLRKASREMPWLEI